LTRWDGGGEESSGGFLFPKATQRNSSGRLNARASVFQSVDEWINRYSIEFR
jgi:hypothetical protein